MCVPGFRSMMNDVLSHEDVGKTTDVFVDREVLCFHGCELEMYSAECKATKVLGWV